ncbi:MAG: DUF1800 domain-containing protein [Xanthomonadales bacterium]|jgi:uncharacterized protein (DUF1800 family)|nr:DUF1800 domain-containing protein [Xanthomonadales bacterium]
MDRFSTRRKFIATTAVATAATSTTFTAAAVAAASPPKKRPIAGATQAAAQSGTQSGTQGAAVNTLTPPLEVRVFHKMGFGPARRQVDTSVLQPGSNAIFQSSFEVGMPALQGKDDITYFRSLGSNDTERLRNYVDQQLDPDSIDDSDFDNHVGRFASSFESLDEARINAFQNRECNGDQNIYLRPLRDVRNMAFNRAIYSKKQLFELIVDFWHNHFNVFVRNNRDTEVGWASWDRDIMRKHAFGNFANMLVDSGKHPVMLRYLDNYVNSAGGINENYARELFELHTLGAINYGGVDRPFTGFELLSENPYRAIQSFDMGRFAENGVQIAAHYFDTDVYTAAAALTGWRYSQNGSRDPGSCDSGEFFVELSEHDEQPKSILSPASNVIPDNMAPEAEGELVMRVAAYHPGTAQHIALKLCQRLISDNPPQSVVDAAAAEFFAHRESPDQIKRTLRVILLSSAFRNTWGEKIKRPFEYICSAMRAAGGQHVFRENDGTDNTRRFHWEFDDTKQELFHWRTPDGYPDDRAFWQGSTSLVQTWQNIDWILDREAGNANRRMMRVVDIMQENLPDEPSPREIAEFWCNWVMGYSPNGGWVGGPGTLYQNAPTQLGRICLQFMTHDNLPNPDSRPHLYPADSKITQDLYRDEWPYYWRRRTIGMIDLILWSPTFIQR